MVVSRIRGRCGCILKIAELEFVRSLCVSWLIRNPSRSKILTTSFAHSFNVRLDVRERLKKLGFMRDMKQLPGLLKQEREGICVYFRLLVKLYSTTSSRECAEKLSQVSIDVVTSLQRKEKFLKTPEGGGLGTPKAADPVKVMEFERE
ncbi:Brefeldin A-inhibited guanine nucleotide-exchange protein 1, partial [Perkinsus olseni]